WTRLIGGTGSLKRQSTVNDPQQRLARFKRVYNQILHTWHKASSLSTDASALDNLRTSFQRLTSILHDESRSPAPHLCLSFASSSQIYSAIGRIASTSHNEGVVREAVGVFSALIDSEEEEFLANERFAEALMTFISKIAGSGSLVVGEDTEADIVELLFGISAKIRLEPEILPIWFSSKVTAKVDQYGRKLSQIAGFAGVTQKEDFPLCYQLIDHVHHEGRIGDFARTGLLYIFESASKSPELEQWIVESDLATLMASGLGALYSQLSRKLSVLHPEKDLPVILAFSDYPDVSLRADVENIFSQEFRIHMDTFLSYLAFWQDVLEHCRSLDVRHTLIDHFQVLFLSQLLYPSLLESSDVDGGSSVAVLTYLRRILDALDHAELVKKILRYLLNLPDEHARPKTPLSPVTAKRRSSLMLLSQPSDHDDKLNPSLFNLVDLLLNSTKSKNSQTVMAALKLVTVIVSKNHSHATGTLLQVSEVQVKESHRTLGALNAELESYVSIASDLVDDDNMNREYEFLLKDMLNMLETHPCSAILLGLHNLNIPSQAAVDFLAQEQQKQRNVHHLILSDPLFQSLVALLSTFLTNNVEVNLSLTEALINLASCPNLRLEGWLVVEPSRYHFTSDDASTYADEEEGIRNLYLARRTPTWSAQDTPPILSALQCLHKQIAQLRKEIPDFDNHVRNRKQAFRVHEEINEAMRSTAAFPPPSPSPMTATRKSSEVSSRALSPKGLPVPRHVLDAHASSPRSQSPRGRKPGALSPVPGPNRMLSPAVAGSGSGRASRARSPAKGMRSLGEVVSEVPTSVAEVSGMEMLKRRIKFPLADASAAADTNPHPDIHIAAEAAEAGAEAKEEEREVKEEEPREASLNHVLTNVVILQEFVLELVALLQVRASLFREVRFA
ncbi:hypothetical protein K490DRAFT_44338, partial [Saccharata proteae CBS 121410]